MAVPLFHYSPHPWFLYSLFSAWIPPLKTPWQPFCVLISQALGTANHSPFSSTSLSLASAFISPVFSPVSLAIFYLSVFWVPLLCSTSKCCHAAGLCANAHSDGWVLFLYMNQLCLLPVSTLLIAILFTVATCCYFGFSDIPRSGYSQGLCISSSLRLEIFFSRYSKDGFSYNLDLKLKYN